MRTDSGKRIPAVSELSKFGFTPDGTQNMWRFYMDLRLFEADGRCQWHVLHHNSAGASGHGADGAEVGVHRFLVDDVATLPIFLIFHDERHRGGGCQDSCIVGGREQNLAFPETNVADTKLHSAGRAVTRWERIFADTQKKVIIHDYNNDSLFKIDKCTPPRPYHIADRRQLFYSSLLYCEQPRRVILSSRRNISVISACRLPSFKNRLLADRI
jgi:hypothetical protein